MKTLAACVVVVLPFLAGVCGEEPSGVFARPRALARGVPRTYAAICQSYYGMGNYCRLLVARLDKRKDGTPNIALDRDSGQAEFTVRLSVNEAAYGEWRAEATRRMKALGLRSGQSDFERQSKRRIAGEDYFFGNNEMAALERLRDCPEEPVGVVSVRVTLVDSEGKPIRRVSIPLGRFSRGGYSRFPLPLSHLNRLRDLPVEQFPWFDSDGASRRNASDEDAYAKFTLYGLNDDELNSINDMKCEVVQGWGKADESE